MELPLELQNQHLLLRLSVVPRTTYLLRAGPIDKGAGCLGPAVRDAALCIAKAGADMVDPLFSPPAAEQIGLPLRLGGCGLPVPTSTLAAADSSYLLLSPRQHCAPGWWGPDLEPLPDPLSNHTLTQAHHTYVRHRAQSTYDELQDIDQPPQLIIIIRPCFMAIYQESPCHIQLMTRRSSMR
jgi:hypothetical protein